MNKDPEAKKALNTDELDQVSGGTFDEMCEYLIKMHEKYGDDYILKMTPEEHALKKAWGLHKAGEPDPE